MKMKFESNYRQPFIFAIAFHLILLMLFLFRFHFDDTSNESSNEIVQATLVTSSTTTTPAVNTSSAVTPSPITEKNSATAPEQKITLPKEPTAPPIHEQHLAKETLPPQREIQKEIQAITEKEVEKPLPEIKEEQPKKEVQKKIASLQQQQLIEKEKQKKLQAQIQQQIETEQKQKKAQPLAKKHQHEIEQLLQQNLVESQNTKQSGQKNTIVTRSSSGVNNKEIDHYKSLIISAISHQWIVPENLKTGLKCHLRVRVAPGGVVMSVKLIKQSGDTTLDRSAESAVYKASPLPVPKDATLFNDFREFNLIVRPEGILAG